MTKKDLPLLQKTIVELIAQHEHSTISSLAEKLDVSRGSVQHALDSLKAKGVVRHEAARWVVVSKKK